MISSQEMDFNVRRAAIRFLTALLSNCTKALQEIILESGPMGVSKLIDLLQDEREVIRNDVNIFFIYPSNSFLVEFSRPFFSCRSSRVRIQTFKRSSLSKMVLNVYSKFLLVKVEVMEVMKSNQIMLFHRIVSI